MDMDAFYASIEALDRPDLVGKPVMVGGLGPRSVVCACSYEARKYGVRSAMPMRKARELCPRAIVLRPRMERYAEVSREIFAFLEEVTSLVEKTSIDEGYLDITDEAADDAAAIEIGRRIKNEIRARFGLSCSVGIAPCKFVAKIASDLRKPDALVLVSEGEVAGFLAPLGVECVPGVGKVGVRKLHGARVRTIGELRGLRREMLRAMFGKWGPRLHDFAHGIDPRPVVTAYERKSLGTEITFDRDLRDLDEICRTLRLQADKVARGLRKNGQSAQTVAVKVRYSNFQQATRQRTFATPIKSGREIGSIAGELLRLTEAGRRPVRLVGVSVSGLLAESRMDELPLFAEENEP